MILAVDTSAWWSAADRDRLARWKRAGHEILLPALAVAERARQVARDQPDMTPRQIATLIQQWVDHTGARVVPLDGGAVRRIAESWRAIARGRAVRDRDLEAFWRAHARDVLLAASALAAGAQRLVTRQPKDFARFAGSLGPATMERIAGELRSAPGSV